MWETASFNHSNSGIVSTMKGREYGKEESNEPDYDEEEAEVITVNQVF
jgi:hypothetical protein